MTSDPLDRTWLPFCVCVNDRTSSDPTLTFIGSNVPTLPFALPTGGAEPLCVSHVYPENVNVFGPVTVGVPPPLPEDPLPDEPLSEDPLLEVPLPDDPALEVPVPDDPLLEVPVPEEPLPDDPLLESVPPDEPLWGGVVGMIPPPHPTRKRTASTNTLILSMKFP